VDGHGTQKGGDEMHANVSSVIEKDMTATPDAVGYSNQCRKPFANTGGSLFSDAFITAEATNSCKLEGTPPATGLQQSP
jgi:hypothetical protein